MHQRVPRPVPAQHHLPLALPWPPSHRARRNPLLLLLFLFPEAEPLTKWVINLPGLGNAPLRKARRQSGGGRGSCAKSGAGGTARRGADMSLSLCCPTKPCRSLPAGASCALWEPSLWSRRGRPRQPTAPTAQPPRAAATCGARAPSTPAASSPSSCPRWAAWLAARCAGLVWPGCCSGASGGAGGGAWAAPPPRSSPRLSPLPRVFPLQVGVLDESWAANQASGFILAGARGGWGGQSRAVPPPPAPRCLTGCVP